MGIAAGGGYKMLGFGRGIFSKNSAKLFADKPRTAKLMLTHQLNWRYAASVELPLTRELAKSAPAG